MHEDVVRGTAGNRVDCHGDRARYLAKPLESGGIAGVDAKVFGQPVRADQADAILRRVTARRRKEAARHESVHIVKPGVADGLPRRLHGQGPQCLGGVALDRALGVADDGHLVAGVEPVAHSWMSRAKAGTEMSGDRSSKVADTFEPIRERCIGAVGQPADQTQVRLLVQFDVDQYEGYVGVEAGEEGLAHHRPGADPAPAAHRCPDEPGIRAVAVRADHIGRVGEGPAAGAAGDAQDVLRSSFPVRA